MFFNDFIKVYPFSLLKIDIYSVENRSVVLKKVIKLDKGIQHFPKKKPENETSIKCLAWTFDWHWLILDFV